VFSVITLTTEGVLHPYTSTKNNKKYIHTRIRTSVYVVGGKSLGGLRDLFLNSDLYEISDLEFSSIASPNEQ
jgi:hypothetical protein